MYTTNYLQERKRSGINIPNLEPNGKHFLNGLNCSAVSESNHYVAGRKYSNTDDY